MRKRLLEYDDVMNSQRTVIYTKRRHALFGERLALDLLNTKYDVCESVVNEYREQRNFDDFKLELIRLFAIEAPFSEADFLDKDINLLTEQLFAAVEESYAYKSKALAERVFPFIKDLYERQQATIENIVIPFSDGIRNIQVVANLRKCFESNGTELINAFEKNITLALIDDSWKEHLREMDDLKQSVQNAVYEQKDPLLIYKFESFELFKQMMERVNREIIAFLCKAEIPIQQTSEVQQAKAPQKTDMAGMRAAKAEAQPAPSNPEQAMPPTAPPTRSEPIRVDPKIGRNDTCPCGSGKKFKNCHGA